MSRATTACPHPTSCPRPTRVHHPLDEQRQRLAAAYYPFARRLARDWGRRWPRLADEFHSVAGLALVEAVARFDKTRNVRLATWIAICLRGVFLYTLRQNVAFGFRTATMAGRVDPPVIHRLCPVKHEEQGRVLLAEPDRPVGEDLEVTDAVEAWLCRLRSQHAAACRLIFLRGKSYREAGKILGVSKARIGFIHQESIAFLRGYRDARVREGA